MKKCPWCAELVQDDAIYCRYCRKDIPPSSGKPPFVSSKHNNNALAYEYKLDAEKINSKGRIDILDVIQLAKIAEQSYSYSDILLNRLVDMRNGFIKDYHLPALKYFRHIASNPYLTEIYFTVCKDIYIGLEQIVVGAQTEHARGNLSPDEVVAITREVTQEIFFNFLYFARELENKSEVMNDDIFMEIMLKTSDTLLTPLRSHASEAMLSSLLYLKSATIKQVVDKQTPFVLELKRLKVLFAPYESDNS